MRVEILVSAKTRRSTSLLLRWAGNLLLVIGILCTGWYLLDFSEALIFQTYEKARLAEALKSYRRSVDSIPKPKSLGDFIGQLDIPRIGLDAIVLEGTNSRTLKLGVGHLPGSALPGAVGNVALAAHRDTFFRALRHIRRNDEIRLTTLSESCLYRVEWIRVVKPTDIDVLRPDSRKRTLTLLTCYPFFMVGPAPDRFVVRALQIS